MVRETPSQNKTADGTVSPTLIYRFIKAGEGFLFAKQIPARTAGEIFAYTWSSGKRNVRSSALSDSLFRKYGDLQDVLIYCRMRPNSLMERASGQVMKRAHRSAGAPSCSLHSADRHDCSCTRSRLSFQTYSFLRWKALKCFILPLRSWRIMYSQLFVGGHLDIYVRWKPEGLGPKGKSRQDFKIVHVSRVSCFQFSCGRRLLVLALGQSGVIVSVKKA